MLNFFTIFWETAVSFFVRTVDEFNSAFSSSPSFFVAYFDTINVFEMVLDDFGFNRRIGTDHGEDFDRNKLFIDVPVSIMMDSMTRMLLNRCSNFPSVRS